MKKTIAIIMMCAIISTGCVKKGDIEFTKTTDRELYDKLGDYNELHQLQGEGN